MKTKFNFLLLALMIVLFSCAKDPEIPSGYEPSPALSGACEQIKTTSPLPDNGASINGLSISGNCLDIALSYGGGCTDHEFDLTWDGIYTLSLPPQIHLYLHHDANNDPCDAIISTVVPFRLNRVRLHGYNSVMLFVHEPGVAEARASILYSW